MQYNVEVYNVNKIRGKSSILEDVNFKLEVGKIYGLVGANGSGKSTILEILLGLCDSTGEVFLNGYNVRCEFREAIKDVGGIVDYVSFYEYLTAYENLRYFSMIYEVPMERIKEVMSLVGLDLASKVLVKHFSLGMKQRLGIAISLLKDPSILILDEPTNGLDIKGVSELRNMLLSFKNKTIIISSHVISEIEKIVDEVLFINNKKVCRKVIDREDNKHKICFKVGNYEENIKNDYLLSLAEGKSVYMSDDEIASSVNKLVRKKVPIYRILEKDSLEEELLSMMEEDYK